MIKSDSSPSLYNRMKYLSRSGSALSTTNFQLWQINPRKPRTKVVEKRLRLTVILEMLRLPSRKLHTPSSEMFTPDSSENKAPNTVSNVQKPKTQVKKLPDLIRASSRAIFKQMDAESCKRAYSSARTRETRIK